jgi:hypothetical protein
MEGDGRFFFSHNLLMMRISIFILVFLLYRTQCSKYSRVGFEVWMCAVQVSCYQARE